MAFSDPGKGRIQQVTLNCGVWSMEMVVMSPLVTGQS